MGQVVYKKAARRAKVYTLRTNCLPGLSSSTWVAIAPHGMPDERSRAGDSSLREKLLSNG